MGVLSGHLSSLFRIKVYHFPPIVNHFVRILKGREGLESEVGERKRPILGGMVL